MNIQWYPGHMTKTKRMLQTQLALVDVVVELLDARVPHSSKNPDIDSLAAGKRRIIVLNKADLADPAGNRAWEAFYCTRGFDVLTVDAHHKADAARVIDLARNALREKTEKQRQRGRVAVPVRAMVVGIPNVGKSTFINQLAGRAGAVTGDRPGVTRGRQWIKIRPDFDMLDTPGILWPKFDDPAVGVKLAATGAVSDDILDTVTLCETLLGLLWEAHRDGVRSRYKLAGEGERDGLLAQIGQARGLKMKGGVIDIARAAVMVLDEFRGGKLGRITLEMPGGTHEDNSAHL